MFQKRKAEKNSPWSVELDDNSVASYTTITLGQVNGNSFVTLV
jgi:hypothetical protein